MTSQEAAAQVRPTAMMQLLHALCCARGEPTVRLRVLTGEGYTPLDLGPLQVASPGREARPQAWLDTGQQVAFSVQLPKPGYLMLFDGCPTGACGRLYPRRAGDNAYLPSGAIRIVGKPSPWIMRGPTSATTGKLQAFLAIVFYEPEELWPGDLWQGLGATPRVSQGGAVSYLFAQPHDRWDYGLVLTGVKHPADARGVRGIG